MAVWRSVGTTFECLTALVSESGRPLFAGTAVTVCASLDGFWLITYRPGEIPTIKELCR